jgi:hypothetical protein
LPAKKAKLEIEQAVENLLLTLLLQKVQTLAYQGKYASALNFSCA